MLLVPSQQRAIGSSWPYVFHLPLLLAGFYHSVSLHMESFRWKISVKNLVYGLGPICNIIYDYNVEILNVLP